MKKILYIEDDQDQIFIYREVFDLKGMRVEVAASANEAFTYLAKEKPDLIMMDVQLVAENGLDILERIKSESKLRDIPVIMFTNTNKAEFEERAKRLGAIDYVIKANTLPQEMADRVLEILK